MYSARIKNKNAKHKSERLLITGFTILELLIVVVTMVLVFSVGMANFRGFQRRRALEGAVIRVKSHLRLAQEMATSGAKPSACAALKLDSITFQRDVTTSTIYHIRARCTDGATTINSPISTYNLDPEFNGINITDTTLVTFLTLGRGVVGSPIITLSQPSTGASIPITISSGGEIF